MDSMTIAILATAMALVSSILSGFLSRTNKDSLALFIWFGIMVFCLGLNSTILLFKLIIGV
jgi:hypothetical protein